MTTRSAELRVLLEAIAGRRAPVLVALDGRSGTGKTTLAHSIATSHDAAIVQGDDFFAGGGESHWAALTPAERQCLHRLAPPTHPSPRTAARWAKRTLASLRFRIGRRFSNDDRRLQARNGHPARRGLLVATGTRRLIGLSVLLQLPDAIRRNRLLKREGTAYMTRWHETWDAAEDYYFTHVRPPQAFDIVIS
jgi:uridine kinase